MIPEAHAFGEHAIVFSTVHPANYANDVNYFNQAENFTFVSIDPATCTHHTFGRYEEGSVYREQYFPNMTDGFIDVSSDRKKLYCVYPVDQHVYIYDAATHMLAHSFPTQSAHFDPPEGAKPGNDDIDVQLRLLQKNDRYAKVFISSDSLILLRYWEGRSEEELVTSVAKLRTSPVQQASFLELYDPSGKKLAQDIPYPSETGILMDFIDKEHILFYANRLDEEDRLEDKLFVITGKLQQKVD